MAGDVPVGRVLDEVAEPVVARLRRVPLAVPDVVEQLVFHVRHRDEPLVGDDPDDVRVTPPTLPLVDRVVVLAGEQHAAVVEIRDDLVVGVADELAGVLSGGVAVHPVGADRTEGRQIQFLSAFEVLLTVTGRRVDESRPVCLDVLCGVHLLGARLVDVVGHLVGQWVVVRRAGQFLARQLVEELVVVVPAPREHVLDTVGREDQHLRVAVAFGPHPLVGEVRVGRDERVRDDRPRGGGPDHKTPRLVGQRELHVHRRFADLVVLHLVVGDGGLTPGTLVDRALPLFDEPAVVDLAERPPLRLHVLRGDRLVRVLPVHPHAQRLEVLVHRRAIFLRELATLLDERLHPVRLDVAFGLEVEPFFDFRLDGEPVHVVARAVGDAVAGHPFVPDDGVLQ